MICPDFVLDFRYELYTKLSEMLQTDVYQLFFTTVGAGIINQIAMYKTKQQFEEQMASIISRLDTLEEKVKRLEKRKEVNVFSDHAF